MTTSQILPIPLEQIRPFPGQPRKWFDPAALQELADSIKEIGQRTPAWVAPLPATNGDGAPAYQLIAGERRMKACALAGVPTLLCEVRDHSAYPEGADSMYVDSVLENFGRKDCTVMEAARAVQRVAEIYCGAVGQRWSEDTLVKVARVFARSVQWVTQHRQLLNLCPEVQAMRDPALPKERQLPTQVALTLCNLLPEVQERLANDILRRGMRTRSALAYIKGQKTEAMRVRRQGSLHAPVDDFRRMTRFFNNLGEGAQIILDMGASRLGAAFAHRPPSDLATVARLARQRAKQLERLARTLEGIQ